MQDISTLCLGFFLKGGKKMAKVSLRTVTSILLMVTVLGLLATVIGTGNAHAGGEEETLEPVGEEIVVRSEEIEHKTIWFIMGFLVAIFITAL
jgi:hypothetical protein